VTGVKLKDRSKELERCTIDTAEDLKEEDEDKPIEGNVVSEETLYNAVANIDRMKKRRGRHCSAEVSKKLS